ncbi:MAG TPA: chloride channel protein [Rhodobiaceae bacterium]|jgi:CIC family chloride channel protein|nr:chloride channel protein [Rhodobiaceae bacterium]
MKSLLIDLFRSIGLGVAFGSIMAVVSSGFVLGVLYFTDLRNQMTILQGELFGIPANPIVILWLLLAATLVVATRRLAKIEGWQTPADSIYAAHMPDSQLDHKKGFASTLAAFISASGGASVGQYGPLVHFGGVMGSLFRRVTGGIFSMDVFIGCGVAGAISAGFGAPIAGIVFAHEAIIKHFSLRAIAPIAISSITASALGQYLFGSRQLFLLDFDPPDLFSSLPFLIGSGIVFGLVAVLFMVSVRFFVSIGKKSGLSVTTLTFSAALVCGCVGMVFPQILGLGTQTINDVFAGEQTYGFLLVLLVAKIVMTAVCLGWGLFGGVFSPALLIGATSGMISGKLLASAGFVGHIPVLSVGGLAAVSASIIGAPMSAVLIVFELSGSYEFSVAAMICVVMSTLVSYLLFGHSYFTRQLIDRQIDITMGRGHLRMTKLPVTKYVRPSDFLSLDGASKIEVAISQMVAAQVSEAYIVGDQNTFIGKVLLFKLMAAQQTLPKQGRQAWLEKPPLNVAEMVEPDPLVLDKESSVAAAIETASDFVGESIPVVDLKTQKLVGVITESDLLQAYLELQNDARAVEN